MDDPHNVSSIVLRRCGHVNYFPVNIFLFLSDQQHCWYGIALAGNDASTAYRHYPASLAGVISLIQYALWRSEMVKDFRCGVLVFLILPLQKAPESGAGALLRT
jgi:hypothetical protein